MSALLLTAWMLVLADDETRTLRYDCGENVCMVVKSDLQQLVKDNVEFYRRMKAAEAKITEPPKCAEVTVTEPSKAPPMPKRPPPPDFKLEQNT